MYNLIEKKVQAINFLPNQALIQPSFVTSSETLVKFRNAISEHKEAVKCRIEVLKYNVEAYQKDIANIEALEATLYEEFQKIRTKVSKVFEGMSEQLAKYINFYQPTLNNFIPRPVAFLKEDMKAEQEQLKDQELRLKILINNEKEINKLYGND